MNPVNSLFFTVIVCTNCPITLRVLPSGSRLLVKFYSLFILYCKNDQGDFSSFKSNLLVRISVKNGKSDEILLA